MSDNVLLTVLKAEYAGDYKLRIWFSDGVVKLCDFSSLLTKGICRKLQNIEFFKQFTIDPFTVDWNNEIGFDPEFLYQHGIQA